MISQKYFQIYPAVHVHLKTDKVDLKKKLPWKKNFLHFFSISSSSRHEKHYRMSKKIYCLFQCSRNYLCPSTDIPAMKVLTQTKRNIGLYIWLLVIFNLLSSAALWGFNFFVDPGFKSHKKDCPRNYHSSKNWRNARKPLVILCLQQKTEYNSGCSNHGNCYWRAFFHCSCNRN